MKTENSLDRVIREALWEDRAHRDVTTTTLVDKSHRSQAVIFSKQQAVFCGGEIAKRVFRSLDPKVQIKILVKDGQTLKRGQKVLSVKGPTRALLSGERVALNFLSYLSAISTKTAQFVSKVRPFKTQILDTRKTTPTLRFLERYAVRCGGGHNHRDHLEEMMMIKDNHLAVSSESIPQAVKRASKTVDVSIIVEVDRLAQLRDALNSGPDIVLLDNMTPALIKQAVALRKKLGSRVLLEASGGIHLGNVGRYAQAGVDRISVGELTHSRHAIDFSMEIL
jgi:nicotinate-nucleotide pyrophosphorylase (carboxylating)